MRTNEIINDWLVETKSALVQNYNDLGLRASGNWEESLSEFNELNNDVYRFGISGNDYTQYIENGRRPNQNQSKEVLAKWVGWAGNTIIKDWVQDKGLSLNPFAVAWKIALSGWSVPNAHNDGGLVSDVVTKERLEDLNRQIVVFKVQAFKSQVIKELKNGNNSN